MIDINQLRTNIDAYKKAAKAKNKTIDFDAILTLDDTRKSSQQEIDELKHQQKQAGKEWRIDDAKALKVQIQALTESYQTTKETLDKVLLTVPNIIHPEVPHGASEEDNIEMRTRGEKPTFDFDTVDHVTLMQKHDMIDIERGVKLGWARSYILKNDGALLERAVLNFAFDTLIKKWFTPLMVPNIVKTECMVGTGYFPGGEEDAYHLERDDKRLIATSEIPMTAYHSEEILSIDELPKTYVAMSACYRREAWTYGKDTHGLYRVHQFNKVEQVVIIPADTANSDKRHQQILQNALDVVKELNIPHRLLQLCSGDLAIGKYNSHDIECWMPSRNSYGETHSATSFLDFQARRLNLRYRDEDGKIQHCYTLNNTVLATPRFLIALIENNQQADGTIAIPEVLQPYMYGKKYIGK